MHSRRTNGIFADNYEDMESSKKRVFTQKGTLTEIITQKKFQSRRAMLITIEVDFDYGARKNLIKFFSFLSSFRYAARVVKGLIFSIVIPWTVQFTTDGVLLVQNLAS